MRRKFTYIIRTHSELSEASKDRIGDKMHQCKPVCLLRFISVWSQRDFASRNSMLELADSFSRIDHAGVDCRAAKNPVRSLSLLGNVNWISAWRAIDVRVTFARYWFSIKRRLAVQNPQQDWRSLLTPREREVGGLVTRGFNNKEIARALGSAQITVRYQPQLDDRRCGFCRWACRLC
jgi:hypothetical protein